MAALQKGPRKRGPVRVFARYALNEAKRVGSVKRTLATAACIGDTNA